MKPSGIASRLSAYARLTRFHSPSGALLLLWPTLWGLWLASEGVPETRLLVIFVAGTFCMRAFGCAVNDIADRRLDAHVERTRLRPLATGEISPAEAVAVAAIFLGVAFVLWLQLNWSARLWALIAALVAATYPLAKRFVRVPQIHLGIAFSFGIPIAYAEVHQSVPALAWAFCFGNFLWVIAYDTVYAMIDKEDDRKAGVYSAALFFGQNDVLVVSLFYTAMILWMSAIGVVVGLGLLYQLSLIAAMSLAIVFYYRIRRRDRAACLLVFKANNLFGALILIGLATV